MPAVADRRACHASSACVVGHAESPGDRAKHGTDTRQALTMPGWPKAYIKLTGKLSIVTSGPPSAKVSLLTQHCVSPATSAQIIQR